MNRRFINSCTSLLSCALALQSPTTANATTKEKVVHSFRITADGVYPHAGLVDAGGTLYGMTEVGGTHDCGAVVSLNPTTGAEALVYSFACDPDGYFPLASLIDVNGTLYGTT